MQSSCLAITLGDNKHFPGGVHYPGAIFRVAIIWGYIQWSILFCGAIFERRLSMG